MRKKVKIYKIIRKEKEFSKGGKSWTSETIGILVNPDEKIWINGFGDSQTNDWKEGDEVMLDVVVKNVEGKTFYNFKTIDPKELMIDEIHDMCKQILSKL